MPNPGSVLRAFGSAVAVFANLAALFGFLYWGVAVALTIVGLAVFRAAGNQP